MLQLKRLHPGLGIRLLENEIVAPAPERLGTAFPHLAQLGDDAGDVGIHGSGGVVERGGLEAGAEGGAWKSY